MKQLTKLLLIFTLPILSILFIGPTCETDEHPDNNIGLYSYFDTTPITSKRKVFQIHFKNNVVDTLQAELHVLPIGTVHLPKDSMFTFPYQLKYREIGFAVKLANSAFTEMIVWNDSTGEFTRKDVPKEYLIHHKANMKIQPLSIDSILTIDQFHGTFNIEMFVWEKSKKYTLEFKNDIGIPTKSIQASWKDEVLTGGVIEPGNGMLFEGVIGFVPKSTQVQIELDFDGLRYKTSLHYIKRITVFWKIVKGKKKNEYKFKYEWNWIFK